MTPPGPAPTAGRAEAAAVLHANWRGRYTVPAAGLYPHQWSWDSAFIAIGLRHLSPRRAQQELESLTGAQWRDGRLPQIAYAPGRDSQYSPGPGFWHSERLPGAPATATAGLVQPPNHAWAAWLVHQADPAESRRRRFLERVVPAMVRWHDYLRTRRSGGGGLAAMVHPWETGMDNAPAWDGPLAAVQVDWHDAVPRPDLDHAGSHERPSDEDYVRYLGLAARYRDDGCSDDPAATPFRVVDPAANALWARSGLALAAMVAELGGDPAPHLAASARITDALDQLWDPGLGCYLPRDEHTGQLLRHRAVTGLVPLVLPDLPRAAELLRTLRGPAFGLGTSVMVPSHDLTAEGFDPAQYWRGPSWFNTAWLLVQGLREHGEEAAASALAGQVLERAAPSGFAEYVDPRNGEGHGTRAFSWTAALALDLLHTAPDPAVGDRRPDTVAEQDAGTGARR